MLLYSTSRAPVPFEPRNPLVGCATWIGGASQRLTASLSASRAQAAAVLYTRYRHERKREESKPQACPAPAQSRRAQILSGAKRGVRRTRRRSGKGASRSFSTGSRGGSAPEDTWANPRRPRAQAPRRRPGSANIPTGGANKRTRPRLRAPRAARRRRRTRRPRSRGCLARAAERRA